MKKSRHTISPFKEGVVDSDRLLSIIYHKRKENASELWPTGLCQRRHKNPNGREAGNPKKTEKS